MHHSAELIFRLGLGRRGAARPCLWCAEEMSSGLQGFLLNSNVLTIVGSLIGFSGDSSQMDEGVEPGRQQGWHCFYALSEPASWQVRFSWETPGATSVDEGHIS